VRLAPDQMAPEHSAHQAFLGHVGPMTTSSPIAECVRLFLKNNTFLGGLPDKVLDVLIPRGHVKKYAKGAVIYRRHDPGDSMMMVLAGRIKVTNVNADGKEVVLAFAARGDLNGEMAMLDGRERTANVTAVENSEVFVLHRRDLIPILCAHPQVMLEMMQILCEKLRLASEIIEDSTLEMRNRTAKGLLRLAQQFGRISKDGIRLDLIVSQSEIGEYLGLSRANVSRQLSRLREANVIKLEGTQLIIIDEKGLSEIAEATTSKN
jgi:CRP/FNR family cyclic AMP-dependent transcriptional regulator